MILKHVSILAIGMGVIGVVPLLADPPQKLSDAVKQELKTLEGKWRVVRFLHSDRETTPGTGDDQVVVKFEGDTIDFAGSTTGVVAALDPSTEPRCLDFKVGVGSGVFKKDSTYESVYKLDGDTLSWAVYTGRGKSRPSTFDKPTDAGVMVMVLKRAKE